MSVIKKCSCTTCNKEFEAHLPSNNNVWSKDAMCEDCFDKWMKFRFKKKK